MSRKALVAGSAVILFLTAGCSQERIAAVAPAEGMSKPAVSATDIDRFHSEDELFYKPMEDAMEGALLARPPADVHEAAKMSSAVVVARVADLSEQRIIGDIQTIGVRLTDVEVLHGTLEPSLKGIVVVELALGEPARVEEQVQAFRSTLPEGFGVWFLRWQGSKRPVTKEGADPDDDPADRSLYGVVHRQGLFVQGADGVINPISEHDQDGRPLPGLQTSGEGFEKLSELVSAVKAT